MFARASIHWGGWGLLFLLLVTGCTGDSKTPTDPVAEQAASSTKYVPPGAMGFVTAKPVELLKNDELLRGYLPLQFLFKAEWGIDLADIESAQGALLFVETEPGDRKRPTGFGLLQLKNGEKANDVLKRLTRYNDKTHKASELPNPVHIEYGDVEDWKTRPITTKLDDQTVIHAENGALVVTANENAKANKPAPWNKDLDLVANAPVMGYFDLKQVRQLAKDEPPRGPEAALFSMVAPIWEYGDAALGKLETAEGLQLTAYILCADETAAKRVKIASEDLLDTGKKYLPQVREELYRLDERTPGIAKLYDELVTVANSIEIKQESSKVKITAAVKQSSLARVRELVKSTMLRELDHRSREKPKADYPARKAPSPAYKEEIKEDRKLEPDPLDPLR